jgi:hypothetical protein
MLVRCSGSVSLSEIDNTTIWTIIQRDVDLPDIADLIERPRWHSQAACRGIGPDVFFGAGRPSTRRAFVLCAQCPVRQPCRDAAEDHSVDYGIWGGTTASERLKLVRRRVGGAAAPTPHP